MEKFMKILKVWGLFICLAFFIPKIIWSEILLQPLYMDVSFSTERLATELRNSEGEMNSKSLTHVHNDKKS